MGEPTGKQDALTEKQEAFVRGYFETGNAAEAYRQAYDVNENARDSWIYVEACQLLDNPKVAIRLVALREQAERLSIFTREKALEEFEKARSLAMTEKQAAAAVSATSAKVKLCGWDRQRLEVTGKDGGPVEVNDARERIAGKLARLAAGRSEESAT